MVRFPTTVPAIPAPPANARPIPQLNETVPVELWPVTRAFPVTAPPKLAATVTVIVGVEDLAAQLNSIFPVVPTPGSVAIPGADNVPVTEILVDGMVTSEVHVAPTFASGSETTLRNFIPSTNGFVIGEIDCPTVTSELFTTEVTVQLMAEAFMMGEMNWAQLISGVISPAPVGRGGRAAVGDALTKTKPPNSKDEVAIKRSLFIWGE